MPPDTLLGWTFVGLAATLALYAVAVATLALTGRRTAARAVATFVPDCVVLTKRLVQDDRVPRGRKVALVALGLYLASPIDLVPDVIPIAGQLDDAILVALVLRGLVRASGPELVREHWPGPPESAAALLRVLG